MPAVPNDNSAHQTDDSERGLYPDWAQGLSEQLRRGRETIIRSRKLLARLETLLSAGVPQRVAAAHPLPRGPSVGRGLPAADLGSGWVTQTPQGRHSRTSELS